MDAVIAIPALDPDARLLQLVDALRGRGFDRIVVVDDGSSPDAAPVFTALRERGVRVVGHVQNLGKGSAIKTAIAQVRFAYPDAGRLITVDADGQHLPDDVLRVYEASLANAESLVLGTRRLHGRGVPLRSRLGNRFSSVYFKMDTGITCPDTQTGLRAIPRSLFQLAMTTAGRRYDFEMNFLTAAAKRGVPVQMVPIGTVYQKGNAGSHFATVLDSFLIYRQFVRFSCSSLACAGIDLGVFALLVAILGLETSSLIAVATVLARVLSGMLNFELNRTWSFVDSGSLRGASGTQALRYAALFVAQMLASMGLVTLFSFVALPLVVVKAAVDGSLFFVSHFIQRNWVFKPVDANARKVDAEGGAYVRGFQGPASRAL